MADKTETKVRLSLDLTPDAERRLAAMAERIGGSKTELIRRAITLIEYAIEAKDSGKRLAVTDGDMHVLRELVVL